MSSAFPEVDQIHPCGESCPGVTVTSVSGFQVGIPVCAPATVTVCPDDGFQQSTMRLSTLLFNPGDTFSCCRAPTVPPFSSTELSRFLECSI